MACLSKLVLRPTFVVVSLLATLGPLVACGGQSQRDSQPARGDANPPGSAGAVDRPDASIAPAAGGAFAGSGPAPQTEPDTGNPAQLGGAPTSEPGGQGGAGSPSNACSSTTWVATASVLCVPYGEFCAGWAFGPQTPTQAIDGDPTTRYTSGRAQAGDEEFTVTFPDTVSISGIAVTAPYSLDASGAYALEFSVDGATFSAFAPPLTGPGPAAGPATGPVTLTISFPATSLRAIKLRQTDTSMQHGWWSIIEFTVIDCRAG